MSGIREIAMTEMPEVSIGNVQNEEAKTGVTVLLFDKKTGALYTNVWVGKYYVNDSGRRTGQTRPDVKVNDNRYTYKSS